MKIQIFSLAIYVAFILYLKFSHKEKSYKSPKNVLLFLGAAALLLRFVIAISSVGYETDLNCFKGWAMQAASTLPWNFYDSIWCDYPPGYLYVLAPIGALGNIGIPQNLFSALIKLPACICDVLTAFMLYKIAKEHLNDDGALSAAALYLFCPATIVNSALWGQVDSVFTLILICSLLYLLSEKYFKSAVLFGVCCAFKMQGIMFAPLYLYVFVDKFIKTKDKKLVKTFVFSVVIGISTLLAVSLPFTVKQGFFHIFEMFKNTTGQYPYASLNAFNLFSALGFNGYGNDTSFLFLNFKTWGNISIVISVIVAGAVYLRQKCSGKLFVSGGILISLIYAFSSDMHERYLFPAIILFLIGAVLEKNKKWAAVSVLLGISQALNVGYLYTLSLKGTYYFPSDDKYLILGSIFTVATVLYATYSGLCSGEKKEKVKMSQSKKITRFDIIVMATVTLLYAILSFVNLGDIKVPETKTMKNGDIIVSSESGNIELSEIMFYQGLGKGNISVYKSGNGENWTYIFEEEIQNCYTWKNVEINDSAKYFRVTFSGDDVSEFYEVAFLDKEGNRLVLNNSGDKELYDEQMLVPDYGNYKNGTYFDEIYHARTAYEHIENIEPYEITHPPLGKIIIGLGIRLFGMNPFGWRVMGNIFGILMLPLMYLFAKRIFKNSVFALFAMLLMCFDFMHFSQTRIATIDSFSVFFIMLMYYIMYIYYDSNTKELPYKKSLYVLFACGIAFGLGIATKWICVYAGAGLAILFAMATVKRAKEGAPWMKVCMWCLVFFVAIPFVIYFASYTPYFKAETYGRSAFKVFMDNQEYMLSYHGKLDATHPFQTPWYHWPLVVRPIWFFGSVPGIPEGMAQSIASFGNPLIWWTATAAAVVLIFKKKKSRLEWFVVIGYLSQYVPWMFIGRIVFIYHYFASVPFIILALVWAFKYFMEKYKKGYILPIAFLCASLVLFVMFYPVLSGTLVPDSYVVNVLRWFPSWVF